MTATTTVLDALLAALRAAASYNAYEQTAPAAVLWTDGERRWEPMLPRLRAATAAAGLPLLTLGPYAPEERCGPAIWLRCLIARTLPEADWPADAVPILYLPGVSCPALRAVEDCPRHLQPLAELQYRGGFWSHRNGKDWTPSAFLANADSLGAEGVERFVTTPELQNEDQIGTDPLPPGHVWAISPDGVDDTTGPGLYRIDANEGPGSGVRILNRPAPAAFSESIRYAEQNLYARSCEPVGDHDPRAREFNIQLRAFGIARERSALGLPALLAICGALLGKSLKGRLVAVGGLNLGGALDPLYNAVGIAELAVEKGATVLLLPVSARRQLNDLSDDMATKISILFYADARDALLKALGD